MTKADPDHSALSESPQGLRWLLSREMRGPLIGGAIAAGVAGVGIWGIGAGSGGEMKLLIEAMLPSTRFLCSSVMTATATILSLMLTMLGFTSATKQKLSPQFYGRVRNIALADAVVFVAATLLLLCISVPINESDKVPVNWFAGIYYFTLMASAVIGGALISIVLMLYSAVASIIAIFHPELKSDILVEGAESDTYDAGTIEADDAQRAEPSNPNLS